MTNELLIETQSKTTIFPVGLQKSIYHRVYSKAPLGFKIYVLALGGAFCVFGGYSHLSSSNALRSFSIAPRYEITEDTKSLLPILSELAGWAAELQG